MSHKHPTLVTRSGIRQESDKNKAEIKTLGAMKCKACGGNEFRIEKSKLICSFCDTAYVRNSGDLLTVSNLIERSRDFLESKNVEAANELCEQALDIDAANQEAIALMQEIDQTVLVQNVTIKNEENVIAYVYVDDELIDNIKRGETLGLTMPYGQYALGVDYGSRGCEQTTNLRVSDRFERFEFKVHKTGFLKPLSLELKAYRLKKRGILKDSNQMH